MILVFTGNGKGKTSAAIGTVIRALGQGKKVLLTAFLKAPNVSGELKFLQDFNRRDLKVRTYGRSCPYSEHDCCPGNRECIVTKHNQNDNDRKVISEGLQTLVRESNSGEWDILIADELLNVYKLFPQYQQLIISIIKSCSNNDLIITGSNCPQNIIDLADYVTDMELIKHPFALGINAKRGIDY